MVERERAETSSNAHETRWCKGERESREEDAEASVYPLAFLRLCVYICLVGVGLVSFPRFTNPLC